MGYNEVVRLGDTGRRGSADDSSPIHVPASPSESPCKTQLISDIYDKQM